MTRFQIKTTRELPRVLIVDDEPAVCQFFKDLYEEMNMLVDTVMTGQEGLKMAELDTYQLIFLDIKLKDWDGIELLKAIKEKNIHSKIIIISGFLTDDIIKEALTNGADSYLFKPLSARDIIAKTYLLIDTPATRLSIF